MKTIATYSFLPWLRQGVANTITAQDKDATVQSRATIKVGLELQGQPIGGGAPLTQDISQSIALYGPGDVVSIDARSFVRLEPRHWITNFEANYFPAIDFSDEDFPWRYTPACADSTGLRLRPWVALVVLTESEFKNGPNDGSKPLPFITVPDAKVFPPADELWAWAHVHFNNRLAGNDRELVSPNMNDVLPRVQAILGSDPDTAYSRLLCPRRLADNTMYHAFLMPTFETGRLACLGHKPEDAPFATASAWAPYGTRKESANYPYYFRWQFSTGSHGDFEYLVSLLKPQPVDKRVGTRDMDVQDPGSNIDGIKDSALGGVLKLGGALRIPDKDLSATELSERNEFENWDQHPYPHVFEKELAKFINLADDYSNETAAASNTASGFGDDPDPLITSPLYGRWHALTNRLLYKPDGSAVANDSNWVHKLNLDPRFRVAANSGNEVIQKNTEEYMNDAWQQIGDVLDANARIRRFRFSMEVASRWHTQSLIPLANLKAERALAVIAPVASRVMDNGTTLLSAMRASVVSPAHTSTAMRRVVRPGARLMRSLPFTGSITPQNLLARVNSRQVSVAPSKVVPSGVTTVAAVASAAIPSTEPSWVYNLLQKYPWFPAAELAITILVAIVLAVLFPPIGIVLGLGMLAGGAYAFHLLSKWKKANQPSQSVAEQNQTPAAVASYPKCPDFVLSEPGSSFRPSVGTSDSPTATNFKNALRDSFALLTTTREVSARPDLVSMDIGSFTRTLTTAVDPLVAIPKRASTLISIPAWILQQIGDQFGEVMAYPKIDVPMYKPLNDLSSELFLPNINLISENSITLIETNQKFIESYMVGLNHEFARKLLWREFPTDQRGSYFRQFWDPGPYLNDDNLTPDEVKEKLYDIPQLHRWAPTSGLGDHNNRMPPGQKGEQAVLVIRGELLKKYPTAVVYAHHAKWPTKPNGAIDPTEPRSLEDIDAAFEEKPPRSIVRTPLYEAKVDPDIYFFGFDLTIDEAFGGTGDKPNDDPGWFFVIKQRPGEPRFGLELSREVPSPEVFVELTWNDVVPGGSPGEFLAASDLTHVSLTSPGSPDPDDKTSQYKDDLAVDNSPVSSARWAYILFRSPIMIAVHAAKMLGSGS